MKARVALGAALLSASLPMMPASGSAQAALDRARQAGPLTVFPDAEVAGRFYYVPGPMSLADRDGRTAVRFLLTRRVGTALRGGSGEVDYFAHLSFDVEIREIGADALDRARSALSAEGISRPELRRLPLRRTEARVLFGALGAAESDTLPSGDFESGTEAPLANELPRRTYTLRLDRFTAEAVWRTLESGRSMVSFAYAYVAEGVVGKGSEAVVEGSGAGGRAPFRVPAPAEDEEGAASGGDARVVLADAIAIALDPESESDLIRIVDLNADRSPPGYGILDLRCYDFRSELRPDLAMKMVELEGVSVNGRPAKQLVIFRRDRPDEAVHRVRFPFAVRLDEPLRYRVTEVMADGRRADLGWQERSWVGVLDVSTPRERLEVLDSVGATEPPGVVVGGIEPQVACGELEAGHTSHRRCTT